ncbi:MAG: hypothetical protein K9L82_02180 [Chromatiaceae bacterium]|nr:hypothetical protein [Chromatiaceae bacterium]
MRQESSTWSSARQLREQFVKSGLDEAQLRAKHLFGLYSRLKRSPWKPDFSQVAPLLGTLREPRTVASGSVLGVIIETRLNPSFVGIVRWFIDQLHIPVQVFHGLSNGGLFKSSVFDDLVQSRALSLVELPTDRLDAGAYNALLLSVDFWRALAGREKILVFQPDAICCRNTDYHLSDFSRFDYIGSLWSRQRPVGLVIDGGNGGLSLRSWRSSVECLQRFPPIHWPGGEDGYFAFHLELMRRNVGDAESCARFGTQNRFLRKSWGAHQIRCLPPADLDRFLGYCPEAKHLLLT